MLNADLATDFGVGANGQIATARFWPGWLFLLLLIPVTSPTSNGFDPWADLPDRYPSYQTCHRRFQQRVRAGVLRGVLEVLA